MEKNNVQKKLKTKTKMMSYYKLWPKIVCDWSERIKVITNYLTLSCWHKSFTAAHHWVFSVERTHYLFSLQSSSSLVTSSVVSSLLGMQWLEGSSRKAAATAAAAAAAVVSEWAGFNGTSTQFRSLAPSLTRKADTESPTVKESWRYINLANVM